MKIPLLFFGISIYSSTLTTESFFIFSTIELLVILNVSSILLFFILLSFSTFFTALVYPDTYSWYSPLPTFDALIVIFSPAIICVGLSAYRVCLYETPVEKSALLLPPPIFYHLFLKTFFRTE